jgi:hypothetical protein
MTHKPTAHWKGPFATYSKDVILIHNLLRVTGCRIRFCDQRVLCNGKYPLITEVTIRGKVSTFLAKTPLTNKY